MAANETSVNTVSFYGLSDIDIIRYADYLNERILNEYRSIDLSVEKLQIQGELEKVKAVTSKTFNQISARVIVDIIQPSTEDAMTNISFWSKVALVASQQFKNLHLEWAIAAGFNHVTVQRIFGPPIDALKADGETEKPGFRQLPEDIQKSLKKIIIDHKEKSFYLQEGYFPPLSPLFGELTSLK